MPEGKVDARDYFAWGVATTSELMRYILLSGAYYVAENALDCNMFGDFEREADLMRSLTLSYGDKGALKCSFVSSTSICSYLNGCAFNLNVFFGVNMAELAAYELSLSTTGVASSTRSSSTDSLDCFMHFWSDLASFF